MTGKTRVEVILPGGFKLDKFDSGVARFFFNVIERKIKKTAVTAAAMADLNLNAELNFGASFRPFRMRGVKTIPFDAELRLEGLDFDRPFGRQFKMRQVKIKAFDASLNFEPLDLDVDLDFSYSE